jgi:hypothetical protein
VTHTSTILSFASRYRANSSDADRPSGGRNPQKDSPVRAGVVEVGGDPAAVDEQVPKIPSVVRKGADHRVQVDHLPTSTLPV